MTLRHSFGGARDAQYGPMRTLDRGLSDFDIRHRTTVNFFYSLPSGSGTSAPLSRVLSQILGSWRAGGIAGLRSGLPTTPQINVRRPEYVVAARGRNLLPGQSNNPTHGVSIGCNDPITGATVVEAGRKLGGPSLFFDPCVFSVPEAGTLGNLGRNTLIGPSAFTMDISLQREFSLGNGRRLQFRSEFFNVMNHPNFRTPAAGSIVFTGLGRFNPTAWRYTGTATTSRQTQFALRFSF